MEHTAFTRNHSDHSSDKGYQFEFFCDRCGTGYRTRFQTNTLGITAGLLRAASSVLRNGILGGVAQGADQLRETLRGEGWDAAFKEAVDEARPHFRQCTRCGRWMCPAVCWNEAQRLCKNCAPDLADEGAALKARLDAQQLEAQMRAPAAAGATTNAAGSAAAPNCPHCHATLAAPAKFCPECGKSLAAPPACRQCGAVFAGAGKFCTECGEPRG